MKHQFRLPIGDWSKDGHNQCDYFHVDSNISAKDLVPIYNDMDKEYQISKECNYYDDWQLSEDFIDLMQGLGLDMSTYVENMESEEYGISSKQLARLILDCLMIWDEDLKLALIPEPAVDTFNNLLAQDINSSLDLPGYGLFS